MKYIACALCLLSIIVCPAIAQDDSKRIYEEWKIIQVVNAIDVTVDQKKWEKCRSYFLDDLDVDFTSLVGGKPMRVKADDLIATWKHFLYPDKQSLHMRTNHQVEISGDHAEVYSHGYALNILPMKNGSDVWEVWGTYKHHLKLTEQGWKVSAMTFKVTYARGNEKIREFVPTPIEPDE